MSFWSAVFSANKVYNYEQVFGVKDVTTDEMANALQDWYGLYYNGVATKKEDPAQRLPVAVVSKLYKVIFSEYSAIAARTGGNAQFVTGIVSGLDKVRKKAVQQMLIGGLCLLKPVPTPGGFAWRTIRRPDVVIFSRDDDGTIYDIATAETTREGKSIYTLLERRQLDSAGYLTITSRLFVTETEGMLGVELPLGTLEKYADLVPVLRLPQPVWSVGLVPLRCPAENCVDGSSDAVSVYAAATGLIHTVYRNDAQLNQEFDNGKMRMAVPDTMLRRTADGRRELYDDIFVAAPVADVNLDGGITTFAPALRDQSYIARKKEALRDIESLIGLKRGILADVETAEKTATEITSSSGEYNLTIEDFQQEWDKCVREAVRVCSIIGQMYNVPNAAKVDPEKDVAISWGNGILYDEDREWSTLMQLTSAGLLKPEIALGWKFDMPTDTDADLLAIRKKYMPEPEEAAEEDTEDKI